MKLLLNRLLAVTVCWLLLAGCATVAPAGAPPANSEQSTSAAPATSADGVTLRLKGQKKRLVLPKGTEAVLMREARR